MCHVCTTVSVNFTVSQQLVHTPSRQKVPGSNPGNMDVAWHFSWFANVVKGSEKGETDGGLEEVFNSNLLRGSDLSF